jgi:hypothetical protein
VSITSSPSGAVAGTSARITRNPLIACIMQIA